MLAFRNSNLDDSRRENIDFTIEFDCLRAVRRRSFGPKERRVKAKRDKSVPPAQWGLSSNSLQKKIYKLWMDNV